MKRTIRTSPLERLIDSTPVGNEFMFKDRKHKIIWIQGDGKIGYKDRGIEKSVHITKIKLL